MAPYSVTSAKTVLEKFFKKTLSKSVYEKLRERLQQIERAPDEACRSYIEEFLSEGDSDPEASDLLRFVDSLLAYTNGDLLAFQWVVDHIEAPSMEAVAAALFPRQYLDEEVNSQTHVTYDMLNEIRERFFREHTFLVIRALVRSDRLTQPVKKAQIDPHAWDRKKLLDTVLNIVIGGNLELTNPLLLKEVSTVLAAKPEEDGRIKDSIEHIKSLKILSRVVEDPEHLPCLFQKGFSSIRRISSTLKDTFVKLITGPIGNDDIPNMKAIDKEAALKIHDSAERADCWNEQLWLSLMLANQKDYIPIHRITGTDKSTLPTSIFKGKASIQNASGRPLNNLTDLFRLEDMACEECESVTSLSAYFASLLDFLASATINPVLTRQVGKVKKVATNLLQLLSFRRPDLVKLDLSCANSQTLVPYISLVNEVLESYIQYISPGNKHNSADAITAYQTPAGYEDDGNDHSIKYRPGNINFKVYQESLVKQQYPMMVFPYDISERVQKSVFNLWEVPFSALIGKLQSPNFSAKYTKNTRVTSASPETLKRIQVGETEVLERQAAAEVLGLHQIDFAAITGETFFPLLFADLLNGFSDEPFTVKAGFQGQAAKLWGYKDKTLQSGNCISKESQMLDKNSGDGLSFIKRQFMPRSGLEFQEVLDLIKTQSFGQHLVITTQKTGGSFTNSIEDLRLLSNAASPPFQPLSSELAFALQSFIRLKTKLKWSIRDLDAAIYLFHSNGMAYSSNSAKVTSNVRDVYPSGEKPSLINQSLSEVLAISPYIMKSIAFLSELGDLCDMNASLLLPLWGRIDSYGPSSLLHRKFKTTPASESEGIFALESSADGNPRFFTVNGQTGKIADNLEILSNALQWPVEDFAQLLQAARLDQKDAQLDIESFSQLYRYTLLCRMLGVNSKDSSRFFEVFFLQGEKAVLESPRATLDVIKQWKKMLEDEKWNLSSLIDVVGRGSPKNEAKTQATALQLTADMINGVYEIEKSANFLKQGAIPSATEVSVCASSISDTDTAEAITRFVESEIEFDKEAVERSSLLESIQDLLTETAEKQPLVSKLPPTMLTTSSQVAAVDSRQDAARSPLRSTTQNEKETSLAATKQSVDKLNEDIEKEDRMRERRTIFINYAKGVINESLTTTLIINTVKALFQDLNSSIVFILISDTLTSIEGDEKIPLIQGIQNLAIQSPDTLSLPQLDAYFMPTFAELYTFAYSGSSDDFPLSKVLLRVDGIEIHFNPKSRTFAPIRLTNGKFYLLQATVPASSLTFSSPKAPLSTFSEKMLISSKTTKTAASIYNTLERATTVVQQFDLSLEEIEYVTHNKTQRGGNLVFDLNRVTLGDLNRLQAYCKLRNRSKVKTGNVLALFSWLRITAQADLETVVNKIALALNRKDGRLIDLLTGKYPDLAKNPLEKFRSFDFFLEVQELFDFDEKLALTCTRSSLPTVKTLFELVLPRPTLSISDEDLERTKALQNSLSPSQRTDLDESLAEEQRRALVEYLLQQDSIREEKIWDADGLFNKFLIDVQMGPQLRTSRIKQAISVVQLFVQRCLLGLEEGVARTLIVRPKWEWMQHYTLWEAHRKMFLYPENWIDPSLRDDKSPLFEQLEATLMQKDLSPKTFLQTIQTYIYNLNEIASLDITAYLHEAVKTTDDVKVPPNDVFHFFGCTRVSPVSFYYRSLTIMGVSREVFWRPWTKIEMDIPYVEMGWEGKRLKDTGSYLLPVLLEGRLYLFMLQLNAKTVTKAPPEKNMNNSFEENAKRNLKDTAPDRQWELMLGWTELVKGVWSPKRLSPGSLTVGTDELAHISQIRMEPVFLDNRLEIVVCFGEKEKISNGYTPIPMVMKSGVIGTFSFTRDQAIPVAANTSIVPPPFATEFGKASGKALGIVLPDASKKDTTTPLIWMPSSLSTDQKDVQWTLSKTPLRITGLVLNRKEKDNSSTSYFLLPEDPLVSDKWGQREVQDRMKTMAIDHSYSQQLMRAAVDQVQPLHLIYGLISKMEPRALSDSFGHVKTTSTFHELGSPSALYNWELGFHAIMLGVDRFMATQQFEEALQVARLLFDPTVDVTVTPQVVPKKAQGQQPEAAETKPATHRTSCWRFPPFQVKSDNILEGGDHPINVQSMEDEISLAISERRSYGQLVHAAARSRPQAYMKWIVMKYAEILIESGDIYFRQGTLESLPLATQRYIEATHVLGPEPNKIPKLGKRRTANYSTLNREATDFDLTLPFSYELVPFPNEEAKAKGVAVTSENDPRKENVFGIMKSTYFGVPINPKFKQMRSKVFQRLYNIRNSLDIHGKPVVYALREPPLDLDALTSLSKSGFAGSQAISMIIGSQNSPMPRHRFDFLVHRALELCSELRALGERLIGSIEKKEVEEVNILNARNHMAIQSLMLDIRKNNLVEAEQTLASLYLNRDNQASQLGFYLELIGEPKSRIPTGKDSWEDLAQDIGPVTKDDLRMSQHEKLEMDIASITQYFNYIIAEGDAMATAFSALPTISGNVAPFGVGASISAGGSNIAAGMQAVTMAMKAASGLVAEEGSRAGRKAAIIRQLQDRRMQANMHGREIKSIDKQIEVQQLRITTSKKEIDVQLRENENAQQMEAWYRTKYTNKELYAWMEKNLRSLHFQAYTLAMGAACQAEAALSFEHGKPLSVLKRAGYWDASRDGLLAADNLYLDLKRLEQVQLDTKKHDFEITKTVSLRQLDPVALMRLRLTGKTEFSISEFQYDVDFPGHYMRRIRSVAVTVPAVMGPHSSINATLTLTDHSYRVVADARTADDYKPNSTSFRKDSIPISSIAICSGSNDPGVFELNFSDSKYLPFEGAGAISSWRLELPQEIRKFDYETISDVLLHIQYTSLDGGACLSAAANATVRQISGDVEKKGSTEGYFSMFDLKNDFVNGWYGFSTRLLANKGKSVTSELDLGDLKERLPFWSRRQKKLSVQSIGLISESGLLLKTCDIKAIANFGSEAGDLLDETKLGKCVMRTRKKVGKEIGNWVLEASSEAIEAQRKEVDNIYLMVKYVYG